MPQFVPLCRLDETPQDGEVCEMEAAGRVFCVARVHGELVVMDNVCPHRGGPIGQGIVENDCIVCPWHAWAFHAKTGCASHKPSVRAHLFPMRIENGVVLVEIEK